jgi:hypothetical protein
MHKNGTDAGIQYLFEIIVRQAGNVADVYLESSRRGHRSLAELPPCRWYILGLHLARGKFMSSFPYACSLATGEHSDRFMHEATRKLPFAHLWNVLRPGAKKICAQPDMELHRLHRLMLAFVLDSLPQASLPNRELQQIRKVLSKNAMLEVDRLRTSVSNRTYHRYRPLGFESDIDFTALHGRPRIDTVLVTWVQQIYPESTLESLRNLFSPLLPMNPELPDSTYDTSHLEAYRSRIDPWHHAQSVNNVPAGQNCTVCAELLAEDGIQGLSAVNEYLLLSTYGHYFYYGCIDTWLNGISQNSNLCPECRTRMYAARRTVRPKQYEQNGNTPRDYVLPLP